MSDSPHDTTNIRISNRINFFAPAVFIGSVPIVGLPMALVLIWMTTHWGNAVLLSAIFVYSVAGIVIVVFACAAALVIAFTITRIHHWNKRANLLTYGEIAILMRGQGEFDHLSAQHEMAKLPEAPNMTIEPEPEYSDETLVEMHRKGLSLRNIEKYTGVKYNRIQRVCAEAKDK